MHQSGASRVLPGVPPSEGNSSPARQICMTIFRRLVVV
ncbi:hypothetical protein [Pseudomonas phage vB_Pae_BR133a]|nr:hypothetical protein [Pseudomonas phage vB_Pae_CF79a]QBI77861.1 hypothetical protein [Pseudomonas phage vB_Pae_CF145a]QBI78769.1 hypothetical protein [Pseudomonas phage vB_Pae_BR133a]